MDKTCVAYILLLIKYHTFPQPLLKLVWDEVHMPSGLVQERASGKPPCILLPFCAVGNEEL